MPFLQNYGIAVIFLKKNILRHTCDIPGSAGVFCFLIQPDFPSLLFHFWCYINSCKLLIKKIEEILCLQFFS